MSESTRPRYGDTAGGWETVSPSRRGGGVSLLLLLSPGIRLPLLQEGTTGATGVWDVLALMAALAILVERIMEVFWDRWERPGVWPNRRGVVDPTAPDYRRLKKVRSQWLGTGLALLLTGLTNVRFFHGLGVDVLFSDLSGLIDWVATSGIIGWGGAELAHSLIEGMLDARTLLKERGESQASRRSVQDMEFFHTYVVPQLEAVGVSLERARRIYLVLRRFGAFEETLIDYLAAGDVETALRRIGPRPGLAEASRELRALLAGLGPAQQRRLGEILEMLTPARRERLLGPASPGPRRPGQPPAAAVPSPVGAAAPSPTEPKAQPARTAPPGGAPSVSSPPPPRPAVVPQPARPPRTVLSPRTGPPRFVYGRPVRPAEFLDREASLRTLFNRLRHNESTAVVGEPHIGKTSLLLKLADEATRREYLGSGAESVIVSFIDLHPIGSDYAPPMFWQEALEPLTAHPVRTALAPLLRQAAETGYARRPLERIAHHLAQHNLQLVLLLDEFEQLLFHPNFRDPALFALLRSLATRTGGLALITSSRLSVAAMNERGRDLWHAGSPFFNNMIELRLAPFSEVTVGRLLDRAGDLFDAPDRRFVRRVAGRHPFLVQAMAATLAETRGEDRHRRAAEAFYERIAFHFDDLWRVLDDRARTTAVILSLLELGGRALGQRFAFREIERVDAFGPELRRLAELGLAERVGKGWQFDWQHLVLWRGERWTVGAQAFVWWVRDVIIAQSRRVPAYDQWLADKRYRLLLTQEQWDWLVNAVRNAPDWAVRGVGTLARALFEELTRKKE
ncbi:MAG TPA: hypothetical protein ENK08_04915 [Chloroflexi bacterium]|nr:hypothetical protein [Chloroflexota bacterium]